MQINKSQLLAWSKEAGVRGGVANMTHSDVCEASADLNVSYDQIREVLDDIIANGISAAEAAGASSASLREAVGDASAVVTPADVRTSPALMGHNLEIPEDRGGMRGSAIALAKAKLADTMPQDLGEWLSLHFGRNLESMPSAKAEVAADLVRDYVANFDPPTSAFERAAFDTLGALETQAKAGVVEDENGKFNFEIMAEMRAKAKAGEYSGSAEAINGVLAGWAKEGGLQMLDVNLSAVDFDYIMTVVLEEVEGLPKSSIPKGIDAMNIIKDLRDLSDMEFYSSDHGRMMGHDLKLIANAIQARLF